MTQSLPRTATDDTSEPLVRVVRGNPTPDELAALVVALGLRSAGPADAATTGTATGRSPWAAYWRSVRRPLHPGRGAWRASGRPS